MALTFTPLEKKLRDHRPRLPMDDDADELRTRRSKFLSWVLRHDPVAVGLEISADGWVGVDALLAACRRHGTPLSRAELDRIVATSDKARFAFDADQRRIRAQQGHSVAVALGHPCEPPPSVLLHGTVRRFVPSILVDGLVRGERHAVHLTASHRAAVEVGARRGVPVVLRVDAAAMATDGYAFARTPNDVWLVEAVPARYLQVDDP